MLYMKFVCAAGEVVNVYCLALQSAQVPGQEAQTGHSKGCQCLDFRMQPALKHFAKLRSNLHII